MARWGTQALNPTIPTCYLIVVNDRGEWLFVLRENTGYQDGCYDLPGGSVEPGEPGDLGAIREGREEAGVVVLEEDVSLVHITHRDKTPELRADGQLLEPRIDFYFQASRWSGTPTNCEPQIHAGIKWIHPDHLPKNVVDFHVAAIAAIRQGIVFSRFGRW